MSQEPRAVLRAARKICEPLNRGKGGEHSHSENLQTFLRQLSGWYRAWAGCRDRGWSLAGDFYRKETRDLLVLRLPRVKEWLNSYPWPEEEPVSLRDVLGDLRALFREFPDSGVFFPRGDQAATQDDPHVWVTTEPITLEGIPLGRFRVCLSLKGLGFWAKALDPNPHCQNHDITHPHVHGGSICLGDGEKDVEEALREGRVQDAFDLVLAVLRTYSPSNPYAALEYWDTPQRTCGECGDDGDDITACHRCDVDRCEAHSGWCRGCEETFCEGCLVNCPGCDDYVCRGCWKRCPHCLDRVCPYCRREDCCESCAQECRECGEKGPPGEDDLCNTCREKECEKEEEGEGEDPPSDVRAPGLAEAPVAAPPG